MNIKLLVQIGDNEAVCLGEGDIDAATRDEATLQLSELFRQAADTILGEVGRELDGDPV